MSDSETPELEQYHAYLLRYAMLQLRDKELAEDAVQETLLAALEGRAKFSGKSSHKTWLTGILKHKVIDILRRQARETQLAVDDDQTEADVIDALFKPDGHWREAPASWGNPDKSLEDKRFWMVFEMCAGLLPKRTARVFMMREVLDLTTDEICKDLSITPTNLWVMLHRARLSLRECLEIKWFGNRP